MSDPTNPKKLVRTRSAAGGPDLIRTEEEAHALADLGEAPLGAVDLAAEAAQAGAARRREAFDTTEDAVLTFAEGIADALTLGLVHEPGPAADIRRDIHSGKALMGQIAGIALGLGLPGPVNAVAAGGKAAGRAAARTVLGEAKAGSRAALGVKGAEGAAEMAALMGAASVGRQVTDTVLGDKEFSATAVLHEAGLGAILGGGVSLLSGVFSRAASRYEVKAQGDLLDATSAQAKGLADHVTTARQAWDDALTVHEQRLGVLKQLEAEGLLDNTIPQFMAQREIALAEAQGARRVLERLDFEKALAGNEREWSQWQRAMEQYEARLKNLDDLMSPRTLERVRPTEPGRPVADPGAPVTENLGVPWEYVDEMDRLMQNPARAAEYERLFGRPYKPQARQDVLVEDGLGGVKTATSELKTPLAKGAPRDVQATPEAAPVVPPSTGTPYTPPGLPRPGERFNPAEWTPARVLGETGEGRVIAPTTPAQMMENELSRAHPDLARDQLLLPDGYFGSVADRNTNAAAFDAFRQRMQPTPTAVPAPAPAARPSPATTETAGSTLPTPVLPRAPKAAPANTEGKAAVRRYLDEWYATAEQVGPRYSPGDYAAQEIRRVMEDLRGNALGRDVAAASTDLATKMRLPEPTTALGATLRDMYLMRRVAEMAADASKGTVMRGVSRNPQLDWILRRSAQRAAGRVGSNIAAGALGKTVGGPLGYFAAAALANQYVGWAGRAAGAAGRLYQRSLKAADSLLKGRRSTYAAAGIGKAVTSPDPAPNRPIAYSDAGPIADPVKRIEELHRVASSPQSMADFVVNAAGDLNLVSPEFVEAAVAVVTGQLMFLREMAPPMRYDALGRPMPPSAGAVRKFLEAENAVFNLEYVLDAVGRGQVTRVQVEALRRAHGPVYNKIAAFLLDDPEKLARLERAKLATIQMIVGAPLTAAADPEYVMRQQMTWQPEQPRGGNPTQALKIPGAGGPPSEGPKSINPRGVAESRPTPSQGYGMNGRAPGN